jgi:hypothetical protein
MLYGMIPLVALAVFVEERPIEWSHYFIGALIYNGVGGMAIATLLWSYILRNLPATISGLNALAVPIVGVVAAWIQLSRRHRHGADPLRARAAHELAAQSATLEKKTRAARWSSPAFRVSREA